MVTAIIKGEGADALKRMTMMTTSRPVPPAPLPPTPHTHFAHCRGQPLNWRCHNFWFPTNLTIQLTRSDDSSQVVSQNNSLIIPRASLRAQAVKNLPANAEDSGLIPGSGRSPGKGNGNPLQYFCLGNPMDRGAWWAAVHGVAKSQTRLHD